MFYDETHLEQEGCTTTHTDYQIRFPRDASGEYSPPSASNPDPVYIDKVTKTFLKFTGQSRLCLGVAAVKLLNGAVAGRKYRIFDYTTHRLINIKEWKR